MEVAGFIRDAFMDCQLTVNNANAIDTSKDMIKVQNGNSIL